MARGPFPAFRQSNPVRVATIKLRTSPLGVAKIARWAKDSSANKLPDWNRHLPLSTLFSAEGVGN